MQLCLNLSRTCEIESDCATMRDCWRVRDPRMNQMQMKVKNPKSEKICRLSPEETKNSATVEKLRISAQSAKTDVK